MRAILAILLLTALTVHATNVDAEYWDLPTYIDTHVKTDMQFTTTPKIEVVSGDAASGDPTDLKSGDAICTGATIKVTPVVNAKWATSKLDVVSIYPTCSGFGYCPAMISYTGINKNRNIKWLTTSVWDSQKTYGDNNPFSQSISKHNELGTFYTQPVTFTNVTNVYHKDKEGGVNIFCKGNAEVRGAGKSVNETALPTLPTSEIKVTSPGTYDIKTLLHDVECFAAVEKRPLDDKTNTNYFYFYYFTYNAPGIPSTIASGTATITVQSGGGTCKMHETKVTASSSLTDADLIMVKTTMKNDGDQIKVTDVTSSSSSYLVDPFPVSLCTTLGFSSTLCPSDNGFNKSITTSRDLYVLVERKSGASGGTVLTFEAETTSATCGSSATCSDTVDLSGAITCDIVPSSLNLGTKEVARFTVSCQDLAGDPLSCKGSNWYWADGLSGGFIDKDSTEALAYTTSAQGSTGTLRYSSGIALCLSDITVVKPKYECEFIPSSASLSAAQSQYFRLNCFEGGSSSAPDDADYDRIEGLGGSTSNSSTAGTTYDAPSSSTSGKLRGYAFWNNPGDDPILGAVAFAPITVTGNDSNMTNGNNTNVTNGGGGGTGEEGSTKFCTISSGELSVFPGAISWVSIKCGPGANETCSGVQWNSITGGTFLPPKNNYGTFFNVTGAVGTSGRIDAYVNGDQKQNCYKPFTITKPDCWEFS